MIFLVELETSIRYRSGRDRPFGSIVLRDIEALAKPAFNRQAELGRSGFPEFHLTVNSAPDWRVVGISRCAMPELAIGADVFGRDGRPNGSVETFETSSILNGLGKFEALDDLA